MIVVRVELHSAITGRIKEIGRLLIYNKGCTRTRGNYAVYQLRPMGDIDPMHAALVSRIHIDKASRAGEVVNHPRLSRPVWSLIARALKAINHT